MSEIKVIHNPPEDELNNLQVKEWPIWIQEESELAWYFGEKETCLFVEGDVVVTPENGDPVEIGAGDLVVFPEGMSCMWKVRKAFKKHYNFG